MRHGVHQERAFYLVWAEPGSSPGAGVPTFHATLDAATIEARRLAELHGGKFYVVRAISATQRATVVTVPCSESEFRDPDDMEIPL